MALTSTVRFKYDAETYTATYPLLQDLEINNLTFAEASRIQLYLEDLVYNTKSAERKRISDSMYNFYLTLCKE